jgi:hypothetical protein
MAGISAHGRQGRDVKLGIVGPHAFVERVMLSGLPAPRDGASPSLPLETELGLRRRLIMAPYVQENEASDKASRLGRSVDACLFASRLPLAYARRAGALSCPATCPDVSGAGLLTAMLQAQRDGIDPSAASFDGVSRSELDAALRALGLTVGSAHVRSEVMGTGAIASFHDRLWRLGQSSAAFTCLGQVARRLSATGVPVFPVEPTDAAVSAALQMAMLLAYSKVLADSQLAVAVVEVPALRDSTRRPTPRQAREELQLTVHRFLIRETQRLEATVSPAGDHTFLIFGTLGSFPAGDPPFAARAQTALGVTLEVGIGVGRSEHEAETQARLALGAGLLGRPAPRTGPGPQRPSIVGPGGAAGPGAGAGTGVGAGTGAGAGSGDSAGGIIAGARRLAAVRTYGGAEAAESAEGLSRFRAMETLARLAQNLGDGAAPVVDAETTARLLEVTPRTARRQLRILVDEGLALPLPPARQRHPGRPRLAYRLVVEKLDPQERD